jgi:hypothetical protein
MMTSIPTALTESPVEPVAFASREPKLSVLSNYLLDAFSVERLTNFVTALDQQQVPDTF